MLVPFRIAEDLLDSLPCILFDNAWASVRDFYPLIGRAVYLFGCATTDTSVPRFHPLRPPIYVPAGKLFIQQLGASR